MPGSSRMSMVSVTETVELTEEQQQKFEHINLSFDAAQPESCSAAIPHLIGLINDPEEVVAAKALQMIRMTAKRDTEARFQKPIIHQQEAITAIIELLENRENSPVGFFHLSSTVIFRPLFEMRWVLSFSSPIVRKGCGSSSWPTNN